MTAVVQVRPYATAGGCCGREVVELDPDTGTTYLVLADYQADGRDLAWVAYWYAGMHGLTTVEVLP